MSTLVVGLYQNYLLLSMLFVSELLNLSNFSINYMV